MQTANFLASIWGLFFIAVPLSLLINPKQIKRLISALENEVSVFVIGIIAFVWGTLTLLLNNVWEYNWRTIITIIGWAAILKGLCFLFMPEHVLKMIAKIKDKDWVSYAVLVAVFIGLVIAFFGFTVSVSAATTATSTVEKNVVEKVTGKVTAVKLNGFTLQNKYTVSVNKNTKIKKAGKDALISNIPVGTNVTITGVVNKDKKTITAKTITIVAVAKSATPKVVAKTTVPAQTITKYDFGASVSDGIFKMFGSMFDFVGNLVSK